MPLYFFLVYVDATDNCNIATFQLGQTAVGTTIPARSWNLKVYFYIFFFNKLRVVSIGGEQTHAKRNWQSRSLDCRMSNASRRLLITLIFDHKAFERRRLIEYRRRLFHDFRPCM